MDKDTLIAGLDFSHQRLMGELDSIEKSGQDAAKVLAWRPGPGRAHIAWQAMHCAATHDRYLNANILKGAVKDEAVVASFAGGSTPSDSNVPSLGTIREKLEANFQALRKYAAGLKADDLARVVGPAGRERSIGDSLVLMCWHESHHQGQIHLTWNLYKSSHGIK